MKTKLHTLIYSIIIFFTSHLFASEYSIVFVHIGKELPVHVEDAIDQAMLFNEECEIYLLGNLRAVSHYAKKYEKTNVSVIPLENISKSKDHKLFCRHSKLSEKSGQMQSSERFFYLAEFANKKNLENIFHLESDMMLYVDLKKQLPLFKTLYSGIAATFDNDSRCVPGFIYFKNKDALNHLTNFMQKEAALNHTDMQSIGCYKQYYNSEYIDHLPITASNYENDYPMVSLTGEKSIHKAKYHNHVDLFNSLFDAFSFGQYLGGIDSRQGSSQIGFVNTESLINPRHYSYTWESDSKGRMIPFVTYMNKKYRLNNLHIHSKELYKFSSHAPH